jgi:hypothetical protein
VTPFDHPQEQALLDPRKRAVLELAVELGIFPKLVEQ